MDKRSIPQFLIAAPNSGSGKTTVSMGLMALLSAQKKRIQPFKCGPDYIDPRFHSIATGKPSINLDLFMASDAYVRRLYAQHAENSDVCIAEGMMGLFDGYNGRWGSSADIARLLQLPVVLVMDAKSTSYTVAPVIHGLNSFDPEVKIAGVIFNRVGSERHGNMLRNASKDVGVPCFGCLQRNDALKLESRYLGLDISPADSRQTIEGWANFIAEQIDLDMLLAHTMRPVHPVSSLLKTEFPKVSGKRIAVARNNEAFAFIYEETLTRFKELGEVFFFDPEHDQHLPANIDILYIPGGYPEKQCESLSANTSLRQEIRQYIEKGGFALAECGGMIYLTQGIQTEEQFWDMAGALPFSISAKKADRKLSLGYRQFDYGMQSLRGHEFHYTQISSGASPYPTDTQVYNAMGEKVNTPVYRYKNLIASYTHLYLGETDMLKLWEHKIYNKR